MVHFQISKIQDGGVHALLSRVTLASAGLSCVNMQVESSKLLNIPLIVTEQVADFFLWLLHII